MFYVAADSNAHVTRFDLLKKADNLNDALGKAIEEWQPVREKTIPMLREIADKIDGANNSIETTQNSGDGNKGILGKIKSLVVPHHEPSVADKIMAALKSDIDEAQKQMDNDHSSTRQVLHIISDIEDLVNQMTHLTSQENKDEMLSILLDVSPGITNIGADIAIKIGEIGQEIADAGKKIEGFGETAHKIGRVATLLGHKTGWIPVVGKVSSKVEKTGEVVEKAGTVASWAGALLENIGDAIAAVNAQAGQLFLKLGGTKTHADGNIQVSLYPLNIEETVRSGVTTSPEEPKRSFHTPSVKRQILMRLRRKTFLKLFMKSDVET